MTSIARDERPDRAHLLAVNDARVTPDLDGDEEVRNERFDIGDVEEGFVATYKHHYPRVVRALELSGLDRSAAEDVAQEAFARTLGHWRRVCRGTNPPGYVYRVAFRLARRASTRKTPLVKERPTPEIGAEATLHVGIDAALNAMPAARRRCAVLCLVVGVSTKEAASTLHIAESTVRKQIERARTDLRAALEADD
ncbi:MAG TPA: sigma factor-like helix-turn-helix DNA-binding protein [Acidimicrobiales bacterium]|nr:sigma factor-like helix-turn-helix DNA-binding protein [Acidimicrobiales bacterium]